MDTKQIVALLPGTPRTFKPKTPIIYQGEAPRCGFFIRSGIVKAYTLQSNGEEQIAAFFGPGHFFPLPWLFGKISTAVYYYESVELSEAISVTRDDIDQLIRTNRDIKDALLEHLIQDQAAYLMRITALEQSRAVEKILFTLYYLLYQFGRQLDENQHAIDIHLTHATIASLVGLTRETTATELNKLKRKKILDYSKKQYTVDRVLLERALGEDSFKEIITKQ